MDAETRRRRSRGRGGEEAIADANGPTPGVVKLVMSVHGNSLGNILMGLSGMAGVNPTPP